MKLSQEELNKIIANHGKWLRAEEGGERADLSYANLSSANLSYTDLRSADLRGANLSYTDLSYTDLRGADLDKNYYQIVRIGSRNRTTTYCVEDDKVLCGCWNDYMGGTLAEFKERVESVYGEQGENPNEKYYKQYMAAIKFFEEMRDIK